MNYTVSGQGSSKGQGVSEKASLMRYNRGLTGIQGEMLRDYLSALNAQQKAAVTAPLQPTLVIAGPGSGKTRVLTSRIAYLVDEHGVQPWRIMAVTFTNKAAREMRTRVEALLGDSLKGIMLGTFHAVCARILREEAAHLSITRSYVIYDDSDQLSLVKKIIVDQLNLDDKLYKPRSIHHAISQLKQRNITPEKFIPGSYLEEIVQRVYARYQEGLAGNNAVDFDDLLMLAIQLFEENPAVLAHYQQRYDHILVDEFQDTNSAQYRLIKLLARPDGKLFVVGDEDQSIYRWRGADYTNILNLREDFPRLQTFLLEQNYRSTQTILDAANAIIAGNRKRTPKHLFTENERGPKIVLHEAHNEQFEAQFVVETIARLTLVEKIEPGDCAVMYRTNAQSRLLEDAFVRANLPYRIVGATRFYSRREIKDLLAFLKVIHNPEDDINLERIINTPPRGIGAKSLSSLAEFASASQLSLYATLRMLATSAGEDLPARTLTALLRFYELIESLREIAAAGSLAGLFRSILERTEYRQYIDDGSDQGFDRLENIEELMNVITEFDEFPLETFLEEVSLVSDIDSLSDDLNAPTLLTLHAAKGLEFDVVFIVGLEEKILPHSRSLEDDEELAEERRLLYVGMTRAKKRLYLLHTFTRSIWGESSLNLPSRFLDDIPRQYLEMPAGYASALYNTGHERDSQPPRVVENTPSLQTLYRTGQKVRHPHFGDGIIIDCKDRDADQEISVAFEKAGIKRLMSSFVTLEVLVG